MIKQCLTAERVSPSLGETNCLYAYFDNRTATTGSNMVAGHDLHGFVFVLYYLTFANRAYSKLIVSLSLINS